MGTAALGCPVEQSIDAFPDRRLTRLGWRALGCALLAGALLGGAALPALRLVTLMMLGFQPLTYLARANYFSTFTPFQNATYPLICFAAAFGSG